MIDGVASQPFSATTLPPFPKPEISFRDESLKMSRENYTRLKEEVEKEVKEWHQPDTNTRMNTNDTNKKINIKKPTEPYKPKERREEQKPKIEEKKSEEKT